MEILETENRTEMMREERKRYGKTDLIMFTELAPDTPGFVAGGFPVPTEWRGHALCLRKVFAFPPIAGYCEGVGRNKYINGCSSSMLICPPVKGNPCLNYLHIPPGTVQKDHRHPSYRKGLVVGGYGRAFDDRGYFDLQEGVGWHLPANEVHHFETETEAMDIIVFHPQSSWGPDSQSHQMLAETIEV